MASVLTSSYSPAKKVESNYRSEDQMAAMQRAAEQMNPKTQPMNPYYKKALEFGEKAQGVIEGGGQRAGYVFNQMKTNPEQFSLGHAVASGEVGGFVPDQVRQPFRNAISEMVPMDQALYGIGAGKPMETLDAGGRMLMTVSAVGGVNKLLRTLEPLKYKLAGMTAKEGVKEGAKIATRDAAGKIAKDTSVKTVGDMRQTAGAGRYADIRPPHQAAIEQAINSGDTASAMKIAQTMPANDPYKASMINMINMLGR